MNITELFEKIEPRLGEGADYLWKCFGETSWSVDVSNHVCVIYDVKTQLVYQITFYDYDGDTTFETPAPAYVWSDSTFKQKYLNEKKSRNVIDDSFTEVYIDLKDIINRVQEYQNVE